MKTLLIITLSLLLSAVTSAQTHIAKVKPSGEKLWGYVNQEGDMIISPVYKKCYQFSEDGLAPIYESKQFSFISPKGEVITTEISGFKLIEGFIGIGGLEGYHEGMVAVVKDKKWGFLNADGKVAIELKYDKVTIFNSGFAIAKIGDSFFVLSKNGQESKIGSPGLIDVKRFSEGLARFTESSKQSGFINNKGEVVISAKFLSTGYFSDGLAWAKANDKKVGFIDKYGEWVIQPQFEAAKNFDQISGLARVKKEGKWVYVLKNGDIISMDDAETWGNFSEGLAKGKKGGKIGYFNAKTKWAITPEFDGGRDFKNGFAAVKKGDKWGFINKKGEWIIEPQFDAVKDLELVK